jgi:hypothetical protein
VDTGELIIKKQGAALDQGWGNQSDGTLFLTNQQLVFQVTQSGMAKGLDLKINGLKDVKVEYLWIPLELIVGVDKKGLSIRIQSEGSIFQEIMGRTGLFGPSGQGRLFENGPSSFNFAMNVFVNKDDWINEINSQRNKLLVNQPQTTMETKQETQTDKIGSREQVIKEKIIVKEVIKIKCPYCGTIYEHSHTRCPHCGAHA